MEPKQSRPPISSRDAAAYIGMSESWLRKGRMNRDPDAPPYVEMGCSIRYLPDDLDEYLASRRRTAAERMPQKESPAELGSDGALHSVSVASPIVANQNSKVERATLRPYQISVIEELEAAIAAAKRRILIVAPTGSGKTVKAAEIIARTVRKGGKVLVLAHRREIVAQTCRKLHDVGVEHGVVQAGFPTRPGEPVQVASIQTLHARAVRSRRFELPPADLVVVDEAHHAPAKTYRKLLDLYPHAVVIGLTATPCRGDGRGLGDLFEELIECPSVGELTKLGYLVPAQFYAPSRPNLDGVQVSRGDYGEAQLAEVMNTHALVGDVISHYFRINSERRHIRYGLKRLAPLLSGSGQ
jgi:superfamily II DNA or RNA helicase